MFSIYSVENIRLAGVASFWIEFITASMIMGKQLVHIKYEKGLPKLLKKYPSYNQNVYQISAQQMTSMLWIDIKIKFFTTCIWTVAIYSDAIPFMWTSFQLADSEFDFTPSFLPLEMRQDISFGFWFALFELLVLEFPFKFFKKQLLYSYGLYNSSMIYWTSHKLEETLLKTMHKTLISFALSFLVNIYDEHSSEYHTLFRHAMLAIVYCLGLFVFEFIDTIIIYMDRETFIPLPEGPLKHKVAVICEKTGFPLHKVYIEVVAPDYPLNAYCVSQFFGLYTRIVFISSLIEGYYDVSPSKNVKAKSPGLTLDELEGIFAHEVGHWAKIHNEKKSIFENVFMEPLLFALSIYLREQKILYEAFHFSREDIDNVSYPLLPGLIIGQEIICKLPYETANAFWNSINCAMEDEADAFSVPIGYGGKLKKGLVKIKVLDHGFPTSDPLYSIFYDHHSSLVERITTIDNADAY